MIRTLKTRNNILMLLGLLLFLAIFARTIVFQNMILILAVAGATMIFLVLRSNVLSFIILLFLAFFGVWFEELGILPGQITWLTEFIILLLLGKAVILKVLQRRKFHMHFAGIFSLVLLFTWISYQFHATTLIHTLLFIRLLIRFYLLFLAIINLDLDEKFMRTINNILIFLFIIQIPTAVVKLFFFGIGEQAIGTYATAGGIPSVVIPLTAISFIAGYYLYYKSSPWYFVLALGFTAFGVIGGKRGLFLYLPVVILFLILNMRERLKKAMVYLVIASAIAFLTGYISIRVMPSLNPQHRVGGEVDLEFVKNYLTRYTMAMNKGASTGRVVTTIQIYEILRNEGLSAVLFGIGPGSYIETRFEELRTTLKETEALPIEYGVTGISWLALQIGYIGGFIYAFLFLAILIMATRYLKSEEDPYWKSFAFGMVGYSFVMFLIVLTYYPVFIDDLLPIVYFILAGFMVHKKIQKDNAANAQLQ